MHTAMQGQRSMNSKDVVSILAKKGRCERASIDEVYLDLTDAAETMLAENPPESLEAIGVEALRSHVLGLNEDGSDVKENGVKEWLCRSSADRRDKLLACGVLIIAELRMQVLKETEFTCSAGIAHNKMLAKLASGMNKPAQQTVVPFSSVKELLNSLPIKKMKQLGGKLGSSLQSDLGVNTVGDLLQFSEEKLQECYGINTGTWLWNIARGVSGEEVQGRLLPKSHGSGKTFPGPCALKTITSVQHWLNKLCEELSERLCNDYEQNNRIAHTLTLHAGAYKSSDTDSQKKFPSKSCPLRYGTTKIQEDALNLFLSGLREFLGSYRIKSEGTQCNGWGITALSVSASKIVAIPSGTRSITKYFSSQDPYSSSSKQSHNKLIQECPPSSPSGSDGCVQLNAIEEQINFPGEEATIKYLMPSFDQEEQKSKLCEDEEATYSSSERAQFVFTRETSPLPPSGSESCLELNKIEQEGEFFGEVPGNKYVQPNLERQEHKRNKFRVEGTSSILRFFQSSSTSCSSRDEGHAEAPSFSGNQLMSGSGSEVNQADLPKESLLAESGNSTSRHGLGQDECRRETWNYNVDEIDLSVIDELPPEIQQELRAWLRPKKRAKISKQQSSIAHYFLPPKNV
ncbi:DNA polymerase eta isoform X2 [Malania oleifera]|uniref:DNA polymerase eta isoform X2 n=1 Tax=Malania oleifera TaxID=397392 RepID=UPI0025AE7832|nr:DNA polymerase eta isoform X2 [Malania oleifera]